jgi:hypothetical protein
MFPVVLVLVVLAVLYNIAGIAGLILLAIGGVLFLLRGATTRARRHNPAPQPPNTHGRRR